MSDNKSGLNTSGVNLADYLSADKKNKSWADQTIEEAQEHAQKPKKSAWGAVAPPKLDEEIKWPTPAPSQDAPPRERDNGPRGDYDGPRGGGRYGDREDRGGRYGDREDRGDRPPRDYDGGRRGGYGDREDRGGYRGRGGRGGYRSGYGDREDRGDRPPRDYDGGRRGGYGDEDRSERGGRYGDRRPPRDYEGRRGDREDHDERDRSEERSPPRPAINLPANPPYTAFVGNLPFGVNEDDIAAFFRGTDIKSIRIPLDKESGKSRGYGYVEFEDVESLEKAIRSSGRFILDRKIRVDVATERKQEDRPPRRTERPDRSERDNGPSNWRSEPKDTDPRDGHQSPPRERKRLDLKPRTAPTTSNTSAGGAGKPKEDIFGGATLSVEKQKKREEELAAKLAQSRDYAEKKAREERENSSNSRGGRGGRGGRQQHNDRHERNGNDGEFRSQNRGRTSSQSEKHNTNPKKKGNDDTVENRFAALTVQGEEDDE